MSTILIIDDDVNALKLLGYTLRKAGFEILVAQDGFEGLEKAVTNLPDLIVSDLMMPKMDGYEVTRRLRSNPATQHIPIIMLTAKSQVNDKVAGFEAGVNDYITKPVMPVELLARIKSQLAHHLPPAPVQSAARIVGFLGVKGGVGLTTLMVNLSLLLQQTNKKVTLVDFQTTAGTVCPQLGQSNTNQLLTLLQKPTSALTTDALSRAMFTHKSGLMALPAAHGVFARSQPIEPVQAATILKLLEINTNYLMVDMGCTINKTTEVVLQKCHQICLVTEPTLLAFDLTRRITQYLTDIGIGGQHVGVVMVNRSRSAHTFTLDQIKTALKIDIWGIISPAPELAFQALQARTLMVSLQPQHIACQQIESLIPVLT